MHLENDETRAAPGASPISQLGGSSPSYFEGSAPDGDEGEK